jgi:hypothetical protein
MVRKKIKVSQHMFLTTEKAFLASQPENNGRRELKSPRSIGGS